MPDRARAAAAQGQGAHGGGRLAVGGGGMRRRPPGHGRHSEEAACLWVAAAHEGGCRRCTEDGDGARSLTKISIGLERESAGRERRGKLQI
jgi:hypothetical protein